MIASGVSQSFSVIFLALLSDFGWPRAMLSGIFSVYICAFFLGGILVGPLLDKWGPRVVISLGALLLGLALFGCSRISSLYQLYLFYGLLASLGSCCLAWLPNSVVISKWFIRKRGMAIGLMMCGNGLGILVFIPLAQIVVEWAGWRNAFLMLALSAILCGVPLNAIFQRARPEDKGLLPDGNNSNASDMRTSAPYRSPANHRVWTLSDAVRHRSFWMMCLALLCNPFATFTVVLHQVAFVVEKGFPPMHVASVFGLIGVFAMLGRFLGGTLSDYMGRESVYSLFMGSFALAVLLLFFLTPRDAWLLYGYVVLLGLGMGVGGAMFPPMLADLFPGPSLGRIMGVSSVFAALGAGFGSWFAGYSYDLTGNYTAAWGCILLTIFGAIVFVWMAAPRKAASFRPRDRTMPSV